MAPNPEKAGTGLDERKRVLIHACSLNRSDIVKKVVTTAPKSASSSAGNGGDEDVHREVLDHVDEGGLTALHHAVKKSSLDVSVGDCICSISTIFSFEHAYGAAGI